MNIAAVGILAIGLYASPDMQRHQVNTDFSRQKDSEMIDRRVEIRNFYRKSILTYSARGDHYNLAVNIAGRYPEAIFGANTCKVTVARYVHLRSYPDRRSKKLFLAKPRTYIAIRSEFSPSGTGERWVLIKTGGSQGWIPDDAQTIVEKSDECFELEMRSQGRTTPNKHTRRRNVLNQDNLGRIAPSDCIISIMNPLVALKSEPDPFSLDIISVRPGEYLVFDRKTKQFVRDQTWLLIEAEGRRGWIRDDILTVASKSSGCPGGVIQQRNPRQDWRDERVSDKRKQSQWQDDQVGGLPEHKANPADSASIEAGLNLARDDRRSVQMALTVLGYDTAGIDGIFGSNTRRAIKDWQLSKDVAPTGYLTPLQYGRLLAEAQPKIIELQAVN